MAEHLHGQHVEGCYRCELTADEVEPYTPTEDEVRIAYLSGNVFTSDRAARDEFDRFLAQVRAEARREGAVFVLREAADGFADEGMTVSARILRRTADGIEAEG